MAASGTDGDTGSGRAGPLLQAGPAPHWRTSLSRRAINLAILVGLAPTVIAAIASFGWGALGRVCLAAGAAAVVEMITQRLMRQPVRIGDLSAIVQGALLALLLPPTVPAWLILAGVVAMVVIAKQLFGGVGSYPFNPVLIAWAVLLLSWGNRIYPAADGLLGTAWTPAALIGGALILVLGHVDWEAPLGLLFGVIVGTLVMRSFYPELGTLQSQLVTGSVYLGAFFLATDTTTSPSNPWPRLLFGLGAGLLIIVLRTYGTWPEPVPFALLLMNTLTPLLDRLRPAARRRIVSHA